MRGMEDFYKVLLAQLRHATAGEKEAILSELRDHVEDHAAFLVEGGGDPAEAQERAVEAMGDPVEVGKALDAQFSPFWLWLGRGLGVGIALLCVALLLDSSFLRLKYAWESWQARTDPESRLPVSMRRDDWRVSHPELRVQVGSDEVYIYRVELEPGSGQVRVFLTNYDQKIFGQASSFLWQNIAVRLPGRSFHTTGSGSYNYGVGHYILKGEVQVGTDYVTVESDQFGNRFSLKVSLDWGDGA